MVLPEATLFPQTMLPLRIFEPRYTAMLKWCLEHDRTFAVALLRPGINAARSNADFHHIAGLGLIRACVARPDGTSDLILQGLMRVRFEETLQETPFRVARWSQLNDQTTPWADPTHLTQELLQMCTRLDPTGLHWGPPINQQLAHISEPAVVADVAAHSFLRDPQKRQNILEDLCIESRIRRLIAFLKEDFATGS